MKGIFGGLCLGLFVVACIPDSPASDPPSDDGLDGYADDDWEDDSEGDADDSDLDDTYDDDTDYDDTDDTDDGPTCNSSEPCTCADGRVGRKDCEAFGACDCSACPPFEVGTPPAFVACGGEPFGKWRLKSVDAGSFGFYISEYRDTGVTHTWGPCPASLESSDFDVRLHLEEGGDANYVFTRDLSFDVASSCLNEYLEEPVDDCAFEMSYLHEASCSATGCGICSCVESRTTDDEVADWSRTATEITVTSSYDPRSYPRSYEYCVEGERMTLRDDTGLVLEMERFVGIGTPASCYTRTLDTCETGWGCHLGACVGDGACSAQDSESSCLTFSGCTWDTTRCAGTAGTPCTLADYGTVPGCDAYPVVGGCVGVPEACEAYEYEYCFLQPGCQEGSLCAGENPECGALGSPQDCSMLEGCSWVECSGTPTPCEQLPTEECESTAGCYLPTSP